MSEKLPKYCDNTSVGVIIKDADGKVALLKRARFPTGIAPPAGHIDNHGTPEEAAIAEVNEEVGLRIAISGLKKTVIEGRDVDNPCRRINGDHHVWWVYEADTFEGELTPDPDEAEGAGWYTQSQVQDLADRTAAFEAGHIPQETWEASPGLLPVWRDFMVEFGYIERAGSST